jgi:peptide/nickel transport system permease protein
LFAYVIRRLGATVVVMTVVAFVVFLLLYLTPGDPAAILAGDAATNEDIKRIREKLGLEEPFLVRFGEWAWSLLRGDLGTSIFTNLPVTTLIGQRIEATLSLSVPVFVFAYILIFVFSIELDWLPVQGYRSFREDVWEWFRHLILPATALGTVYMALIARITRASMLDVLAQDYIRTAQAKGLGAGSILTRHALKNAAIPIVTIIGIGVALLIGGAIVTETVFAIPGIGRLTVDAILRRDYPIIQGVVLLFSAAYVLINLVVDLSYMFFDPRVRY